MGRITRYLKQLGSASAKVAARCGRPRVIVAGDMVYCTFAYQASPNNYAWCGFERLNASQRRSYMTHGDSEHLIALYNDEGARNIIEDKVEFARAYRNYFGREWIDVQRASRNELLAFLSGKRALIAKPLNEAQGRGIEKITPDEFPSIQELATYLQADSRFGIVEEFVEQHAVLSQVYNEAVAVIRVVTVLNDEGVDIINAAITFGNDDDVANIWRGGLYCAVNVATGEIQSPAVDKDGVVFERHPKSGVRFPGFVIPQWDDVLRLVREASRVVPLVRYVGWDIAVATKGPILIEGNTSPGYTALQHPVFRPDGYGLRPAISKYLVG